jgi:hypothetical protein
MRSSGRSQHGKEGLHVDFLARGAHCNRHKDHPLRLKRLLPAAKSARNPPHRSSIPDTGHFAPRNSQQLNGDPLMNSQSADRDSSADPTSSVEPASTPTSQQAPNPLWLIAAAMAFFFTAAAFFLAAG